MKNKSKTWLWISLIVVVLIILAVLAFVFIPTKESTIPTSSTFSEPPSSEKLDYCSTESGCYQFLLNQGITQPMLAEKGIKIECSSGTCYASKI